MPATPTRLGYGCARLFEHARDGQAHALLETALDHGIRHIDVGRSYGDGRTEWLVGDVAKQRRDEMFIATKAGIDPPGWLDRVARKIKSPLGSADSWTRRRSGRFGAEQIAMSALHSLRALRVDRIDLLLLHECEPHHLTDELLWMLRRIRSDGYIRYFGIATSLDATRAILSSAPEFCDFVQVCDGTGADLPMAPRGLITHSILSRSNGCDKTPSVLLTHALERNPHGTVLFSSGSRRHIAENAQTLAQLQCVR